MLANKQSHLYTILSVVQAGYRKNKLTVSIKVVPNLFYLSFLQTLRTLGVIGHFEVIYSKQCATFSSKKMIRVYLRYVMGRPAVKLWAFPSQSAHTYRTSLHFLQKHLKQTAGLVYILQTAKGFLTAQSCLDLGYSGFFLFAYMAG